MVTVRLGLPARQTDKDNSSMQPQIIDMKDIVAILQRQRRLIVLVFLLTIGAAVTYLSTATPVYQATVLIEVGNDSSNLLDPNVGQNRQSAVLNSLVDGEVEILRSQAMALAVVERAGLVTDPEFGPRLGKLERLGRALGIELSRNRLMVLVGLEPRAEPSGQELVTRTVSRLRNAIEARRKGLTYLIAVSASSANPERAAEIANTVAQVYIERQVIQKTDSVLAARDVLRSQIERSQAGLAASEGALNAFIEDNLAQLEAESANARVPTLRRQLDDAKAQRAQSLGMVRMAETALADRNWAQVSEVLGRDALAEIVRQREELEQRIAFRLTSPAEEADLRAELAAIDRSLEAESATALEMLRNDLVALGDREEQTRDLLREALLAEDLSSEMLAELFSRQQAVTLARQQSQMLLSREQDFGTLAHLQIADARVVSEALPPNGAAFPDKKMILAVAVMAAVGLSVLLAFVSEYHVGGITSASQMENLLQLRVPVSTPSVKTPRSGHSVADLLLTDPLSVYGESLRKLRSGADAMLRMMPATSTSKGRIILVCSALPNDGKSSTALALGRTYALAGRRTLLIEADLRKPTLAGALGVPVTEGGLLKIFEQGIAPGSDIATLTDPKSPLSVLLAGGRGYQPTDQLLGSDTFSKIIAWARENFDEIIIDSPAILPVADAMYLVPFADLALMIARYSATKQSEAREAVSQVQDFLRPDAQVMGVLSHVQHLSSRYVEYDYSGGPTHALSTT
jgi:polysaccharide biosynthesis transport protein